MAASLSLLAINYHTEISHFALRHLRINLVQKYDKKDTASQNYPYDEIVTHSKNQK